MGTPERKPEEEIVALNQAQGEKVAFNIPTPPYIDPSLIGIRMTTLLKIMHISGIGSLMVSTHKGNNDQFEFSVDGVAPDGSATGTGKAKKASCHENATVPDTVIEKERNYSQSSISLNVDKIAHQLSEGDTPGGLRNQEAWTRELDSALREELLKIVAKNLSRPTAMDLTYSTIATLLIFFLYDGDTEKMAILRAVLVHWGLFIPILKIITNIWLEDQEARSSFFNYFGIEIANLTRAIYALKTQRILVGIEEKV